MVLDIDVELGRYADLGNGLTKPDDDHRLAGLLERIRRLGGDAHIGAEIGTDLGLVRWLEAEGTWPAPSRTTPIGEAVSVTQPGGSYGVEFSRKIAIAGQPQAAGRTSVLRRMDLSHRERAAGRGISRLGRSPLGARPIWYDTVIGYRLSLFNLARVDRRLLDISGRGRHINGGVPGRVPQANAFMQERMQLLESVAAFSDAIAETDRLLNALPAQDPAAELDEAKPE